jgi:DNA helicase-2/ATP-dependent DNA helicase PcrA
MDKKVIFAVAGSGKTRSVLNSLDLEQRALVITYTNNNLANLKNGVLKKWDYIPSNIKVTSYFTFLYSFCYRPFLFNTIKAKGINWDPNPNLFAKNDARFIDGNRRLYSNRIAKLIEEKGALQDVNNRLLKYFDTLYIDEVQDFAGNDFNFLKGISGTNIGMLLVGDFYQHTFDTSRDRRVNESLHEDYSKYRKCFEDMGFTIDIQSLDKSHRCSPTVCEFISKNIGIQIESHRFDDTKVELIENQVYFSEILNDESVVKLFYREHYKHDCYSRNWGDCKGEDKYNHVCVVLNKKSFDNFKQGKLGELPAQTRNKLYVACSRAKGNLYLAPETFFKK